jgi:leucyl-tRNA synthetase
MHQTGYVKLDEPFAGVFTQGMVLHESYQDQDGDWLYPDDVEKRPDGSAIRKGTNKAVTVGPSIRMSKSKKNVVAPMGMIDAFGADAIRWFMLSDSPPERDVDWSESGAEGCWRFVQRIHRMVTEVEKLPPPGAPIGDVDGAALQLRQATHRAIAAVTDDLENLRFNRAVAQLYSLANAIQAADAVSGAVRREALESIVLMLGPMMPHLAETCWEALGYNTMVVESPWPKFESAMTVQSVVTYAVQVNGKLRAARQFVHGTDKDTIVSEALKLDPVMRALEGKAPKKTIFVPGRIVNFVA